MTEDELINLAQRLIAYCKKFNVPVEHIFDILEDQKVTPMIRGKAMEYNLTLSEKQFECKELGRERN